MGGTVARGQEKQNRGRERGTHHSSTNTNNPKSKVPIGNKFMLLVQTPSTFPTLHSPASVILLMDKIQHDPSIVQYHILIV